MASISLFTYVYTHIYVHILCSTHASLACEGCVSEMRIWAKKWGWRRRRLLQCFFFLLSLLPFYKSNAQVQNAHSKPEWKNINYVYSAEWTHHAQFPVPLLSLPEERRDEDEYFLLTFSKGWSVNQKSFPSSGFDFKGLTSVCLLSTLSWGWDISGRQWQYLAGIWY